MSSVCQNIRCGYREREREREGVDHSDIYVWRMTVVNIQGIIMEIYPKVDIDLNTLEK